MAEAPPAVRFSAWIIAGPTGSGKSTLAVEVAERCGGEIVGADAFQIYAGLPVLTAQPKAELRARVPHHLIGEVPLTQAFDAGQYLAMATARLAEIRGRGRQPIIVGGTGLYLRTLLRGLAELPPADAALRAELASRPAAELQTRLRALDPATAVDLQNPRRVVRALEVCLLTGRPFSSFRAHWGASDGGAIRGMWLDRAPLDLERRLAQRTATMFREGVVEEVRACDPPGSTAVQAIGLREIQALLQGRLTPAECEAAIGLATRQYAKRQRTWLRRETALGRLPC